MPKEYSRTRRVGEQIQRELAQLVREEVKDPRVGMITINAVEVSRDFSHAKVYFTSLDDRDHQETVKALARTAGFLRKELGRRLMIRTIPQLHFFYDESIERGARLSALIEEAVSEDKKHASDPSSNEGENQ